MMITRMMSPRRLSRPGPDVPVTRHATSLFTTLVAALVLGLGLTSLSPLALPTEPVVAQAPTSIGTLTSTTVVVPRRSPPLATVVKSAAATMAYHGKNRVWYPIFGINHHVGKMACSAAVLPGAGVYIWGCAGPGNTYLVAHAWAAFKPLFLAYQAHRLRVGQSVWYANAKGQVRHFKVAFWKVVRRDASTNGWAWAESAEPVLTLQTCVDQNVHVLVVRLRLIH